MKNLRLGLSYDDVLLVPKYSKIKSRSLVNLSTQITPRVKLKIPIISINMTDVTETKMAIALGKLGGLGFIHRFQTPQHQADMIAKVKKENLLVAGALGCRNGYIKRAEALMNAGADILTLDIAHGSMEQAIVATKSLKQRFGKTCDIISGVIATYDGAVRLYEAGADCVRVGVGPGTICITRTQTGVGVPQITAVSEAFRAAKKYKKTLLCDGGTKSTGDIVKGLAAGASAVVMGSQLAGHNEAPGRLIIKNGKKYKTYNASTSLAEKQNHVKKLTFLSKNYTKHIEGVESLVPYKGPLRKTIELMVANIRSGYSYVGAQNIKQLWKNAEFIRVSPMGKLENGWHDVTIQK